ncbi:MAG: hypothetical protein DWQ31_01335 [Planctomycetota bacterium]|nr:MAG: hypothetical protein DWQ31_01335 [Planctomycetota bacterium]REJ95906.1 MAG: hypothetical protein DWQ35_05540 [Planctomycetota bacterium]
MTTLRAGAAQIEVNPPAVGTVLAMRAERSTGIAESLFARALVLDDGTARVVLVTNDYCGFDIPFHARLAKAISAATDIPVSHIMINSSHNHSAPLIGSWAPPNDGPQPWHDELIEKFARVARQAADDLRPARLRFRREATQIGMNRRLMHEGQMVMAPNPHGNHLPWIDVLSVAEPDGKRIAVLFSHAAHPVVVQSASTLIGGDYPGYTIKRLEAMARAGGSRSMFMFAQGAGGDINAFPLAGGIQAADTVARDLSYAVARAIKTPGGVLDGVPLRVGTREVALPLQEPPPRAVIEARIAATRDERRQVWLRGLLAMQDKGQDQRTMAFPMTAFALGDDFCLLGLPHETFSYYTLFAERVSPFESNMVLGYTNGVNGYVATRRDYLLSAAGGYEASRLGSAMNYTTRLAPKPESQALIEAGIRDLYAQVLSKKKEE